MIEKLQIDTREYPFGFLATRIQSENCAVLNKTCRADFYQLFWVVSGSLTIHIDSETYVIKQDECSFIGKDQVYSIHTTSHFDVLIIRFNESFYCRNDLDARLLDNCLFFDNSKTLQKFHLDKGLKRTLKQYYNSLLFICTKPFDELMYHFAHNTVERLLLFSQNELIDSVYSQMAALKKREQEIASNFKQLLKRFGKEQRLVKFYADTLLISDKRLTDICNKIYKESPKKLICAQVILEAKRLLAHSSLNVKEIAFELRFAEPSNFIRFFTKYTGKAPKAYRDDLAKVNPERTPEKLIA